ncbi:YdeI/OmpD-associated family protein [Parapedobacter sp. 10938]|uniref:YdeI/OmpD-associated family protein n=1 Tax=Parapedobacter flavus TaxID=3110225 RepID=UPI002DBDCB05|nr:YdeI/OmpD-associated family protein [Parapedobacter sp. 10938]MEC3881759.1 YdeI/OmpD-associated family protein [Parapedobacter sp. 10938]
MWKFTANLKIIGINPYVFVPEKILSALQAQAGKDKSPIPIKGTINGKPFRQTLVKYSGSWRLYVNTEMLKNSPKRIGETVTMEIAFDPADRSFHPHPKLAEALAQNKQAKERFDALAPYMQKEIVRYISSLKTEATIERNVAKAIDFLLGKGPFIGRKTIG